MPRQPTRVKGISDDYEGKSTPIGVSLPYQYQLYLDRVAKIKGYRSINQMVKEALGIVFPSPNSLGEENEVIKALREQQEAEEDNLRADEISREQILNGEIDLRSNKLKELVSNAAASSPEKGADDTKEDFVTLSNDFLVYFNETIKGKFSVILKDDNGETLIEHKYVKSQFDKSLDFIRNQARALIALWREKSVPLTAADDERKQELENAIFEVISRGLGVKK